MNLFFVGDWLPSRVPVITWGGPTVGNLECVLSGNDIASGKAYTSILPIECVENAVRSGMTALSHANNHVYDAGPEAFIDMKDKLAATCQEIQFFGTVDKPYATLEAEGKKVAVIGALEKCRSRGSLIFKEEDVEKLIRDLRGKCDVVYVYPHWGKEGEYTRWPSPRQQKLARRWIDAGADGVFGSHSHVFQGREFYKGKPIYYSLGNFYFPHPESKLYEGTDVGLCVEIAERNVKERFVRKGVQIDDAAEIKQLKDVLESISAPLRTWTTWRWARAVGPFNLKKNTASWQIRLRKNFVKTLPKFLVWQILPKTVLFRLASLWR